MIALCGYKEFGAKPYWVPRHLLDVDICSVKLGSGWHIPTEAEIGQLSEADFQFFADTMTTTQGGDFFPNEWYYRLDVYIIANDGSLALGSLAPGASHIKSLPIDGDSMATLYIGNGMPIGLRCLRSVPAP